MTNSREYMNEYQRKNKEKLKEIHAQYYAKNKTKILKKAKIKRIENHIEKLKNKLQKLKEELNVL